MESPEQIDSPEPETVECFACSQPVRLAANAMTNHFKDKSHPKRTKMKAWDKESYLARYGTKAKAHFISSKIPQATLEANARRVKQRDEFGRILPGPAPAAPVVPVLPGVEAPQLTPEEAMLAELNAKEIDEYQKIFDSVFQQVDRDEVQIPLISSLAFTIISASRIRVKTLSNAYRYNEDTEKALKSAEERISKLSTLLGIDRQTKQKYKVSIKSTPSAMISGYLDEIARMSTESLQTLKAEEDRILSEITARIAKHILSVAPDKKVDPTDDDESYVPDLDAILRSANITV